MDNIIYYIKEYLCMKEHYKQFNKENLFDVFNIFESEVFELNDIVRYIEYKNDIKICNGCTNVDSIVMDIYEKEEQLLNEIADVLLTTARLIKEFKLEEPLTEMMEYKYHRQLVREENIKNG